MPAYPCFGKHPNSSLLACLAIVLFFILHASTHAGVIGEVAPWGRSTYVHRWQPEQIVDLPSYIRVSDLQGLANPQLVIVDARPTNRKVLAVISLATTNAGSTRLIVSPSTGSLPIELNPLGNTVQLASPLDSLLLSNGNLQKRHLLLFNGPTNYKVNSIYTTAAAGSAKLIDSVTLGTAATPLNGEFTTAMSTSTILGYLDHSSPAESLASLSTFSEMLYQETVAPSPYVLGLPDADGLIRDSDPNYRLPYWWEPASWNALTVSVVAPEPASFLIGLGLSLGLLTHRPTRR